MDDYPMSPDTEWPDAWLMPDQVEDQCAPNRLEPNVPVSAEQMRDLGICYWKMEDVDNYDYPIKAIPWDPKDAKDPKLQALRDARGYSYADIITVHPDHLPDFDLKIKAFFEEHIHDAVSSSWRRTVEKFSCFSTAHIIDYRKKFVTLSAVPDTLMFATRKTSGCACMSRRVI